MIWDDNSGGPCDPPRPFGKCLVYDFSERSQLYNKCVSDCESNGMTIDELKCDCRIQTPVLCYIFSIPPGAKTYGYYSIESCSCVCKKKCPQ
jgi:hypothetical protein